MRDGHLALVIDRELECQVFDGEPAGETVCNVLLANSARADRMFYPLVEWLFGKTCLPWFWMGYVPYNQNERRTIEAREKSPQTWPAGR